MAIPSTTVNTYTIRSKSNIKEMTKVLKLKAVDFSN